MNWDEEPTNPNAGILTALIDKQLAKNNEEKRTYIGASSVGHICERQIWYRYNGFDGEPISPTLQRTFEVGKRLEDMVLDYLEEAGLELVRTWWDLKDEMIPEFQGHCDAVWKSATDAIIEVKTARDSSFRIFAKQGLMKWYPIYYSQLQSYMGMSGIKESYIIAINKDTSELHDERVLFDEGHYHFLQQKAQRIIDTKEVPAKVNNSPMYYVCKSCQFKTKCHS
jgi:hypothetical protein